jgi:hypothetical protein
MADSDSSQAVFKSSAAQLAKIMSLDETTPDVWSEQDLAAMLRHQMTAPLNFDLSSFEMKAARAEDRRKTLASATKQRIKSFEDLLFHREPPLELLKLSKEFFKRRLQKCKKDSPEWNLAYLFYLLSILAAGDHASKVSSLTSNELRIGMKWVMKQQWANNSIRELMNERGREFPPKGSG